MGIDDNVGISPSDVDERDGFNVIELPDDVVALVDDVVMSVATFVRRDAA